ncbi:MAG: rod shape-determining protein MreD [Candidatus Omnitrophica bacterium]|nr:rod shape-determining protein MreD [Candidatus Omnitrophota bacterium]
MKNLLFLLTIIILASLGLNWPIFLNFFYCKPDLLLIFMVALVFYTDFKTALIFGILAGLTKDVFLPWQVAINTICFSVWSYCVYRLGRQISTEENYVRMAVVLVVALLNNFIIGIQSVATGNIMPPGIFLRNLIIVSIYTSLLSPLVFKLTKKIAA